MSKLPIELINLIMLYVSTPVADIFKKEIKEIKDGFNKIGESEFSPHLSYGFAEYFFYSKHCFDDGLMYATNDIYYYCNMDEDYINTLVEYYQNH